MADWFETRFREPVDPETLDPAFAARVRALVVKEWQADAAWTSSDGDAGDRTGDTLMLDARDRPTDDQPTTPRRRRPSRWLLVAAAAALVALVSVLVVSSGDDEENKVKTVTSTPDGPQPAPEAPVWPGPVRDPSDVVHRVIADDSGSGSWDDPSDAPERWADMERLHFSRTNYGHWNFGLAAAPPPLEELEPGVVIAYGLVLDVNADGVADYVVSVDNDAPRQGDFRARLTDLETGETDEQVGPPYGTPIEWGGWDPVRYDEPDVVAEPGAVEPPPTGNGGGVILTFLNGAQPADLDLDTMRFYAWTSVARDGLVVAHDYAPDTGWLSVD